MLSYLVAILLLFSDVSFASSLDGSSTPVYQDVHHVFSNTDTVQGFVRLNSGFTILEDESVVFDTFITVSGDLDLRKTGTVILKGDLGFSSSVTITNGGMIHGGSNTLKLGGNLTIPSDTKLLVVGDLVIDGRGCTLDFEPHAQLLVDRCSTLTLKNVILKSTRNAESAPFLSCVQNQSSIALQNVDVRLSQDYYFTTGKFFIHHDVVITGTSSFIYSSPECSFIAPCSQLLFDKDTTLFYAPTIANNELIQLQSQTSGLVFDNASFHITSTGVKLTKGTICFDNCVTLSAFGCLASAVTSGAMNKVATDEFTSNLYNADVFACAWSKDGQFLAVGGAMGHTTQDLPDTAELKIYSFDGTSLNLVTTFDWAFSSTQVLSNPPIGALAWHPNGQYLAVGGSNGDRGSGGIVATDDIKIFHFDGSTLRGVASGFYSSFGGLNQGVNSLDWNSKGQYLAVGGIAPPGAFPNTRDFKVFEWNGVDLIEITGQRYRSALGSGGVFDVSWSPDDKHLAVVGGFPDGTGAGGFADAHELRIYDFDGSTLTANSSKDYDSSSNSLVVSVGWHPSGNVIAIGGQSASDVDFDGSPNTDNIRLYTFDGSSLTDLTSVEYSAAPFGLFYSLAWHPSGSFLVLGGRTSEPPPVIFTDPAELRKYFFDGQSLVLTNSASITGDIQDIDISSDGKYIATGSIDQDDLVEVYECSLHYIHKSQGDNGTFVFGCDAQGEDIDPTIVLNAGARVCVTGNIDFDFAP